MSSAPAVPRPPFRSLANSLIRRTVTVAAFCTVLAGAIQATVTVAEERKAFERALRNVAELNVPLLSVSLWDIEPEAVRRQLRQIASQPEIAHVRLEDRAGHSFEAGDQALRGSEAGQVLKVPYPDGRVGILGTLEVSANREALMRHVTERVITLVAGYAALSAILCILIAAILRLELKRPLRQLARFTVGLTPDRLTQPLEISRPQRRWQDEIDLVVSGFRTLQDGIHAHVESLDHQVAQRTAELEAALVEIRALTVTDALTGCHNRRFLDERLLEEVLRSQRAGRPLAVIIADIDHFKSINDTYGHAAGDQVLQVLARVFQGEMRARIDWVARFGGEEFVIVLPDSGLPAAARVAERLRAKVAQSATPHGDSSLQTTASFGVAECRSADDAASLLARADSMLYRAKASGRNRVEAM